uniref:Uncharacterized protein n=1 Tax=Romanomermis culicivorax TaxID=13658 RepID=A0A915HFL0_ROMCU
MKANIDEKLSKAEIGNRKTAAAMIEIDTLTLELKEADFERRMANIENAVEEVCK